MEKSKHLYTVGGNVNWYITGKTVWMFLNKLKLELPYVAAVPLVDIYPKETKSLPPRKNYFLTFISISFTIANLWK